MNNVIVGVPFFNHLGKEIALKAGFSGTATMHTFCLGSSLCSQSSWQNSFVHFLPPSFVPKSFLLLEDLQLNVVQILLTAQQGV